MSEQVTSKFPTSSNKVKHALNNDKLAMYTPQPDGQGKSSRLVYDIVANNPRIICYTNIPEDNVESKNWGRISANLDLPTFYGFLDILEKMADAEPDTRVKIDNRGFTYISGKRSESTVLLSELFVGKDQDGKVWISVITEGRPKVKFTYGVSDYHSFTHGNGVAFTEAEASCVMARATARLLREMCAHLAVTNYVDINALAEARKLEAGNRSPNGGGNYNGGNRQGGYNGGGNGNYNGGNRQGGYNGGGNYNRQPEISGEDIPF
jgi:hypothetical protein